MKIEQEPTEGLPTAVVGTAAHHDRRRSDDGAGHSPARRSGRLRDAIARMQRADAPGLLLAEISDAARIVLDADVAVARYARDRQGARPMVAVSSAADRAHGGSEKRQLESFIEERRLSEHVCELDELRMPIDGTGDAGEDGRRRDAARQRRATSAPARAVPAAVRGRDRAGSWLVSTLDGHDGKNLGVVELHGKRGGSFSSEDEEALIGLCMVSAALLERAQACEDVRRAIESRDELLSIVGHDLRSPLNAIAINADLLASDTAGVQPAIRRRAEAISRSAAQMKRLVDDLDDAACRNTGHLSLDPRPHDVAALVRTAIETISPLAVRRGLEVVSRLDPSLPPLVADGGRVVQVLQNIIGNAVKFTREGRITVSVTEVAGYVRFAVDDPGPGIPSDEIGRIFERRWRGGDGSEEGAGLGLMIAKSIVEAQGGHVWVDTTPGAGSTFFFTLPTGGVERPPAKAAHDGAEGGGTGPGGGGVERRMRVIAG